MPVPPSVSRARASLNSLADMPQAQSIVPAATGVPKRLNQGAIPMRSKRKNTMGFPDSSVGKESACNAGDPGLIPGSGRSPGEGLGYPLQYSGLKNSMDCIVHGAAKSWTRLSNFHFQPWVRDKTTADEGDEVICRKSHN